MRLACSTLLYSRLALPQALQRIAALGFSAVDIAAMEGWASIDPSTIVGRVAQVAGELQQVCDALALTPVAFNAGIKGTVKEQERQLAALAALAQRLAIPVITLGAASATQALVDDIVRFRYLIAITAEYGIHLTVEVHFNTHTQDPDIAIHYVQEIPSLGLTLDPGHLAIGSYWERGMDALLPYVRHVHLRQAGRAGWSEIQLPVDAGCIDFPHLLKQLQATGYTGAYSIEYVDSIDGVDHERETMRLQHCIAPLLA